MPLKKIRLKILKFYRSYSRYLPVSFRKNLFNLLKYEERYNFKGWRMATHHAVPWEDGMENKFFLQAHSFIKNKFELTRTLGINRDYLDELLWRHWVISYAIRYVIEFTENKDLNLVECGVGDGLTAYIALKELKEGQNLGRIFNFTMHLYDSWQPMRSQDFLATEKKQVGRYGGLKIERTKKNLGEFTENITYHQGYIPENLELLPSPPQIISYLHIDLNSAKPTRFALEFFFPRILKRGIIVFDDYGSKNYKDTKIVVDKFFKDKSGILMPLPTGQAIYYR